MTYQVGIFGRTLALPLVLGLIVLLLPWRPVHTDIIRLKNGRYLYGRVVYQSGKSVTVETEKGKETFKKTVIRNITYEPYEVSVRKKAEHQRRERKRRAWLKRRRALDQRKLELARRRLKLNLHLLELERRTRALESQKLAEAKKLEEKKKIEAERQAADLDYRKRKAGLRAVRAKVLRDGVKEGYIEKPKDEPIGYWDFAWRSAVLPGWGHLYMKKPAWGYGYAALSGLALVNWLITRGPAVRATGENEAQSQQTSALAFLAGQAGTNPQVPVLSAAGGIEANRLASDKYRKRVSAHNQALMLLAGVYGLQLTHIILTGLTWEEGGLVMNAPDTDTGPRLTAALYPTLDPTGRANIGQRGIAGELRLTLRF